MSEVAILNALIKDSAKVAISPAVELIEPSCPDSKVIIRGVPSNSIIIKVDSFRSPDSIFNGLKSECKRSDYVIISNSGNKQRILIIELKRTKGLEKDIIAQLKGSFCFIEYCKKIVSEYWNENNFLGTFKYRYVSFGHTSIAKRKTRVERNPDGNDVPERMLKINHPNYIQFNHLVGA